MLGTNFKTTLIATLVSRGTREFNMVIHAPLLSHVKNTHATSNCYCMKDSPPIDRRKRLITSTRLDCGMSLSLRACSARSIMRQRLTHTQPSARFTYPARPQSKRVREPSMGIMRTAWLSTQSPGPASDALEKTVACINRQGYIIKILSDSRTRKLPLVANLVA